jgi:hypothetical protein
VAAGGPTLRTGDGDATTAGAGEEGLFFIGFCLRYYFLLMLLLFYCLFSSSSSDHIPIPMRCPLPILLLLLPLTLLLLLLLPTHIPLIINTLPDQHAIRDAEIHGDSDDGGD